MDIEFSCQKCHQKLVIDSAGAGKIVVCSNCQESIVVPDIKPVEVNPINLPGKMKDCPFCGEQVFAIAKKCKHCGETIDVVLRTAEEAVRASGKQNVNVNQNVTPAVVKEKMGCLSMIGLGVVIFIILGVVIQALKDAH